MKWIPRPSTSALKCAKVLSSASCLRQSYSCCQWSARSFMYERLVPYSHPAPSTSSGPHPLRSEEHTSELQSPGHLVCRLLLEKKNAPCLRHPHPVVATEAGGHFPFQRNPHSPATPLPVIVVPIETPRAQTPICTACQATGT